MPQLFKSVTEARGIDRGPVAFNEPGYYSINPEFGRSAAYTRDELNSEMQASGFIPRRRSDPRRVAEAARLMADVIAGREDPIVFKEAMFPTKEYVVRHILEKYPGIYTNAYGDRIGLRETMSYSDYSALTVDILDRAFYGYYTAAPITNMPLVKPVDLRDFRLVARYAMDGAVSPWTATAGSAGTNYFTPPAVPHAPGEPPTERSMVQVAREVAGPNQRVTYQPQLYQAFMSVNWRALVNDDLGIFKDLTNRLAIGGRRTIYQYITSLYSSTTGPNTTLFNATFANIINTANGAHINNPPLDFQGIQDGMIVLAKQKDIEGQPITFAGTMYLVYGPALSTIAKNLKTAVQADISILGGTQNTQGFPTQRLRMDNWVAGDLVLIEDKYLPIICTTANTQDTQWYLFYDPNAQERPALELGFLKGFREPQMFQKIPTTMRVGGAVDPMMGDFRTMDQDFKGVTVFGGTQIDGRSCVSSTGQSV
jgi:hypothetical protein